MRLLSDLAWMMRLKTSEKSVLLRLADAADDRHIAFPGVPDIAWYTGLSERQVQRDLKALEAAGLLHRQFRNNSSTIYTVLPRSKGRVLRELRDLRDARRREKLIENALKTEHSLSS